MTGPVIQRRLLCAGLSTASLLLCSALNTYQKYAAGAAHATKLPFSLNVILMALAAATCYYGLATPQPYQPARAATPRPKTYDPLLTLRAFACLMVLTGHAMGYALRPPQMIPAIQAGSPVWLITSAAEAGVWMFFTLSGYLIGKGFFAGRYNITRPSVRRFYINRILRIMPVYWVTLTVFCAISNASIFAPHNWPAFFSMMLFNLDGNLPYMPIGALWSVGTEIQFYALAPMLFVLMQACLARPAWFIAASGLVLGAAITWRVLAFHAGGLANWYQAGYTPLAINLDLFWIGMAASRLVLWGRARAILLANGVPVGFMALAVLYGLDAYLRSHTVLVSTPAASALFTEAAPTLTALLTALAIACFELAPPATAGTLTYRLGKPTAQLGLLTYAAYAVHEPILLAMKRHLGAPASIPLSLVWFVLALAAVFMLAAAMYSLVERPFERLKEERVFFFVNKKEAKKTL